MEAWEAIKYIALKILMAETSVDDCPKLHVNELNASHYADKTGTIAQILFVSNWTSSRSMARTVIISCFVYPVLGPKASLGLFRTSQYPDKILGSICLKTVQAIDFLRGHGICHGAGLN